MTLSLTGLKTYDTDRSTDVQLIKPVCTFFYVGVGSTLVQVCTIPQYLLQNRTMCTHLCILSQEFVWPICKSVSL